MHCHYISLFFPKHKIPHKDVKNFTRDWNDGTVVAALVDSIAPGLCPDADVMEPKNALRNATDAMKLAEEWLGVPMVRFNNYQQSIMCFLLCELCIG